MSAPLHLPKGNMAIYKFYNFKYYYYFVIIIIITTFSALKMYAALNSATAFCQNKSDATRLLQRNEKIAAA